MGKGEEGGDHLLVVTVCKEVAVEVYVPAPSALHTPTRFGPTCFALPGTLASQEHNSASSCRDSEASCSCRKLRVS